MGAYVDPLNAEPKDEWLKREGIEVPRSVALIHDDFDNNFLVVLMDNVNFHAAGICYDAQEREIMLDAQDWRLKRYFIVPKEKLLPVSKLSFYLGKRK